MSEMEVIVSSLEGKGYYVSGCAVDFDRFAELSRELGHIYHQTDIRIDPHSRTYFRSPNGLALHNDDFDADYVAWYCNDPGNDNVATVLLDEAIFWRKVPTELYPYLHECYIKRYEEPLRPILRELNPSSPNIYFIPWNTISPRTPEHQNALNTLTSLINEYSQSHLNHIFHKKDHFLIIDNRRILHGRSPTSPSSSRHLVRLWIKDRESANSA